MIKGLPRGCDDNAVFAVLDSIAMYIGTVAKLSILDGSTASVDMETEEGARMLAMYGKLDIDGVSCNLDPCFYMEQAPRAHQNRESRRNADWICTQCNTMNFARRHECFQCQAPRQGNSVAVEDTAPQIDPRLIQRERETTLLVRDIPEHTSEHEVRVAFNPFGQIYEVRHLPERCLAFVEFDEPRSLQQAMRQAKDHGIRIDGSYVNVTVARGRDNPPSNGDKSGAHAAIEQAMAMAQARNGGGDADAQGFGQGQDSSDFKLDPNTGFYYNDKTQQYYDEKSGVYYTHKDGSCYYFDPSKQEYVACAAIGSTLPPGSDIAGAVAQGAGLPALVPDQSKVAVAVAVPKAKKKKGGAVLKTSVKTLDTTKWSAANQEPEQPTAQGQPLLPQKPAKANMANFKFEVTNFKKKKEPTPPPSPQLKAAATVVSAICYLCNRKFPNLDVLKKHTELSLLHKENLASAQAKERERRAAATAKG